MDIDVIKEKILKKIEEETNSLNCFTSTYNTDKIISEIIKNLSISYKLLDK